MSILILTTTLLLIAPLAFVLGAAVSGRRTSRDRRPARYPYSPGNHAGRFAAGRGETRRPVAPAAHRR